MSALAASVQFQSDWWEVLQTDFMRNALLGDRGFVGGQRRAQVE